VSGNIVLIPAIVYVASVAVFVVVAVEVGLVFVVVVLS
jgi:hypothetical protein